MMLYLSFARNGCVLERQGFYFELETILINLPKTIAVFSSMSAYLALTRVILLHIAASKRCKLLRLIFWRRMKVNDSAARLQ